MKTPPRRLRRIDRWLSANGRSLEITKAGWLHVALCIGVGFAAINSGSNLLHLLFGCQMGLVVISGVLSERMLARARVHLRTIDTCHARTPAPIRVEFSNASPRAPLFATSVEMPRDAANEGPQLAPAFCLHVSAKGQVAVTTSLTMPQRGWAAWPTIEVVTSFPFGLFVKRRRLASQDPLLVHPYAQRVTPKISDTADLGQGEGQQRPDRSGEIVGLTEYRPGGDAQRLDWRAFARRQRLFVREFVDQQPHAVDIFLNPGTTGDPAFETRVEAAAGLAQDLLLRGEESVALYYGTEVLVTRGAGMAHLHRVLDALALVGAAQEAA